MQTVVIQVPSKSDIQLLLELARKMGFKSWSVSDRESRLLARQKLAEMIENVNNAEEPAIEEILSIVEDVRTRRHPNHFRLTKTNS